jgi:hypothetical protein
MKTKEIYYIIKKNGQYIILNEANYNLHLLGLL